MSKNRLWIALAIVFVWGAALALAPSAAQAAPPVVKTVPWVASNPLIPHDTYPTKSITLKGTCDAPPPGITYQYFWDFGDGSSTAPANVTDNYALEARHVYVGAADTVFTARLTVQNMGTGEIASKEYYVAMRNKTQDVEVNVAIDEGLWYLHKAQLRSADMGDWRGSKYGGYADSTYYGVTCTNLNAFQVNGHVESGSADNPYVETVQRGMKRIFTWLVTRNIGSQTNPLGTFNPDTNGNGIGIYVAQSYPYYQGGMFMDAIVASGTPNAVATTGAANIIGRTYKDIVQDMVDEFCWAQYDYNPAGGGWRYNANEWPDNSVCQWVAIGMIAAEKNFGCTIPQIVKDWNMVWLTYSQHATNGYFGYTDANPIWGPFAVTPSGMVQMAMNGYGRGDFRLGTTAPSWDKAETYLRKQFDNGGGYSTNIKAYYYGLFSFVKTMLLHNHGGTAAPIKFLRDTTLVKPDIDWYAAETANGDTSDGVARTLINAQSAYGNGGGYWYGHNASGDQYPFETAWAIIMLHRTLFEAGAPVAVAKAIPNPGVAGQTITLTGAASYQQDPTKHIVAWEWDLNNDGAYDVSGATTTTSFAVVGSYPIKLRVTDDSVPPKTAETVMIVQITSPPIAPTADAGGPYHFCPGATPWILDASKTVNPDQGQHEPGPYPGDTIYANPQQIAWDLGSGSFTDDYGTYVDVTAYFQAKGPGSYLIRLKVTDTTSQSFPSSGMGDLSSITTAYVYVHNETDSQCINCTHNLTARAKLNKVQLQWEATPGAVSYNIYRGDAHNGPYAFLANSTNPYRIYLDASVETGKTYYYVVRPCALNGDELCQSNEGEASVVLRPR